MSTHVDAWKVRAVAETKRVHLVIGGCVQGVFFRDSVRRAATGVGVAGWVANRLDGAVEAVLEGPADAVDDLVAFCHRGPSRARVDYVDIAQEPPAGLDSFDVR